MMTQLSAAALEELAAMDDYDRTLAYDRIARQNNMTAEEVQIQLQAYQQGGAQTIAPDADYDAAVQTPPADAAPVGADPNYLQDAHRYRVRYDPSHDGQSRQSQIDQAIMCSHCGAPLGIPAVRPIKVTCPNCMNESQFNN